MGLVLCRERLLNHHTLRKILVPSYFHAGGIAGGLYALGALDQWGAAAPPATSGQTQLSTSLPTVAEVAFAAALPLVVACAVILIVDLTRPTRFWRLMTQFKLGSAVSIGTWTLLAFGLAALLVHPWTVAALGLGQEDAPLPPRWVHAVGLPAAFLLISYTGVLLSASARPLWSTSHGLGAVFVALALEAAALAAWFAVPERISVLGPVAAASAALALFALGLHLWRAPRVAPEASARLARGDLALLFRVGVFAGGMAPQVLWLGDRLPGPIVLASAAAGLCGSLALRAAVFLCDEPE